MTELMMDVAAALPLPRLEWLQIMHHKHMGLLSDLNDPMVVCKDPSKLPKFGLPALMFKPSRAKTDMVIAFVPTNVHVQQITVTSRAAASVAEADAEAPPAAAGALEDEARYECVTCGLPVAHARHFNAGGLEQIRKKLTKCVGLATARARPSVCVRVCSRYLWHVSGSTRQWPRGRTRAARRPPPRRSPCSTTCAATAAGWRTR
jgi:hypothetical protein